ncbi:MAG: DUF2332 domain-containing protein [Candidatus Nanopelagicales bacterium]
MASGPVDVEERSGLAAQFSRQARDCADIGSALYADLCRSASLELSASGELSDLLAPWGDARDGDLVPLRVLAAAHRLVLEREAPALALWFPSVGGSAPVDGAGRAECYRAWRDALARSASRLPELLASPPQTNEPARSAAFAGAFAHVAAAYRLPLVAHELGASAGLNLVADHVRITWLGGARGPQGSPLVLEDAWDGDPLPPEVDIDVRERVAVDLAPVDVTTTEGRLHLTSFVWPDQSERFERLRAAYQLAARVPVRLVAADVVDHVRGLEPVPGSALVVAHSTTWIYLDEASRAAADAAFVRLGERASPDAPVVHVSREPHSLDDRAGRDFELVLRCWPAPPHGPLAGFDAGTPVLLARTSAHGIPVTWQPATAL